MIGTSRPMPLRVRVGRKLAQVFLLAAALTLLLVPATAAAQSHHEGRGQRPHGNHQHPHGYIGGQLMGMAIADQSTSDYSYLGHGGGGGLFGGFRLSPFIALEGNWALTYHGNQFSDGYADGNGIDAFYVMMFTIDAKIFIPTHGPLEPYFQAGLGYAYTGATYNDYWGADHATVWASGPTFALGGGLDLYLADSFSVGARLLYRGFYFSPADWPNADPNFISGVSLDVNVAFHF